MRPETPLTNLPDPIVAAWRLLQFHDVPGPLEIHQAFRRSAHGQAILATPEGRRHLDAIREELRRLAGQEDRRAA